MELKAPKFNINHQVHHVTPDSDKGVVLDCSYSLANNKWSYLVSFGIKDNDYWYMEHELSTSKTF